MRDHTGMCPGLIPHPRGSQVRTQTTESDGLLKGTKKIISLGSIKKSTGGQVYWYMLVIQATQKVEVEESV
jgi:hypothetical protein